MDFFVEGKIMVELRALIKLEGVSVNIIPLNPGPKSLRI